MDKKKKTIVVCSSGSFYEHVNKIAEKLKKMGYRVVVPATADDMRLSGNYDISSVKTWHNDPKDFHIKIHKARTHFDEVANGDAVLIVNDDKPGQPNYMGPNTTMEWGLAYYLGKPVFILNGVDKQHNAYEEVYSMSAAVLDGDLSKIKL